MDSNQDYLVRPRRFSPVINLTLPSRAEREAVATFSDLHALYLSLPERQQASMARCWHFLCDQPLPTHADYARLAVLTEPYGKDDVSAVWDVNSLGVTGDKDWIWSGLLGARKMD